MRKMNIRPQIWATALLPFLWIGLFGSPCLGRQADKIGLSIYYAGHQGSTRESDFLQFFNKHFKKVGSGDLAAFKPADAEDYDVVVLDYDGDGFDAPRPKIKEDYSSPIVAISVVGALTAARLRLKCGYI